MKFLTRYFQGKKPETLGVILVLIVAIFWGMFPIVVNKGSQHIPPLFFAAASIFMGAIAAAIVSLLKKDLRKILNKKALVWGVLVAFTMAAFPYGLMFIGARLTSGINTSALLLSEIIFTIIITPILGEKPTLYKTFGGLLVLFGAFVILFKGGTLNIGDLLIIVSTALLPFGNYCGKRALHYISAENLLIIRYFIGGLVLFIMSVSMEDSTEIIPSIINYWPYIALNGVLLLGLVNILWYEGLKRLQVSKAVFLLMTYPIFSLLFLSVFYDEKPNIFQMVGVSIIVLGAYFTAKPDTALLEFSLTEKGK